MDEQERLSRDYSNLKVKYDRLKGKFNQQVKHSSDLFFKLKETEQLLEQNKKEEKEGYVSMKKYLKYKNLVTNYAERYRDLTRQYEALKAAPPVIEVKEDNNILNWIRKITKKQ